LTKYIERAGLAPGPRLFRNVRASRETELAGQFPLHVVTEWRWDANPMPQVPISTARLQRPASAAGAESGAVADPSSVSVDALASLLLGLSPWDRVRLVSLPLRPGS